MPTEEKRLPTLPLAAVGIIIIGSIGPWVTVEGLGDFSEGGLESDGIITLVLALIVGGLVLAYRDRPAPRGAKIGIGICAVAALAIAIIDVLDVTGTDLGVVEANVGWGLWLTLVGSILLVVAIVLDRARATTTTPSSPAAPPPSTPE